MHHLDLGLFKYMLDYTQSLLIEQCGNWVIEEFNNRLAAIPKFPGLKIFNNGITAVQTADEHRMVMKVIISIVDGIFNDKDQHIRERSHKSQNSFISLTQFRYFCIFFFYLYIYNELQERIFRKRSNCI